MSKKEFLYEGKAKRIYRTDDPGKYLVEFKDEATAFDGKKRGIIEGKGVYNNLISAYFFKLLEKEGIPTHYLETISDREMLVRAVTIVPLEVVVRNVVAGSLSKRLGLPEGTALPAPIVEFYYKRDDLGDPMLNCSHIQVLGLATEEELKTMRELALRTNEVLRRHLEEKGLLLVDFKLEFGRTAEGTIILADEISPDTCRFWDRATTERLDKDRFRRDLGGVAEAYAEVWRRLVGSEEDVG
ncbi:phosphoribosylaminoimidazole-succinocarboxamide synthase [Ammonifex degensii KC4]|uniref:Phosphoribosylaminoimidazole-succinocarboxamide synthase n=1 Tax=Ammonifex degensii (strain DSM 10501 / KC4) TaxID=429009 RepID=C9RB44_AMMDK|nr:phosphoribosylaminoimidazolesuccinocarboxamide synthase [Ammonifex degensii]ACX51471.1 phosphoribosylaminoimidazole-succinocarboxamide synthase [Ammonifex degensii KC4]